MADDKWKQGIKDNWAAIIKNLGNPDELLEYLHHNVTPPLLNEDQVKKIKCMTGNREKTRKLINTLLYRDDRVLPALVLSLRATKNEMLAELLEPYENKLTQERRKKLHLGPEVWPPSIVELEEMHEAAPEQCDMTDELRREYTHHEEVYTMTAKRRGLAVIINNVKFNKPLLDRTGSNQDQEKLSRVLCQLHFFVRIYNDMISTDMLKIAEESSHWENHQESDCFMFVVLSHGCSEGVYGTDGGVVHVDNIVKNFNSVNCPQLKGKPKVFLFQACRLINEADDDTDVHKAFENLPNDCDPVQEDSGMDEEPRKQISRMSHVSADFFFAYATPEGFRAYRQEKRGSWFIQAIVWVLKYNAHKDHLLDLMRKVNKYVSTAVIGEYKEVQVSQTHHTLRKRLYFFPGIYNDPPEKNDYIGSAEFISNK